MWSHQISLHLILKAKTPKTKPHPSKIMLCTINVNGVFLPSSTNNLFTSHLNLFLQTNQIQVLLLKDTRTETGNLPGYLSFIAYNSLPNHKTAGGVDIFLSSNFKSLRKDFIKDPTGLARFLEVILHVTPSPILLVYAYLPCIARRNHFRSRLGNSLIFQTQSGLLLSQVLKE